MYPCSRRLSTPKRVHPLRTVRWALFLKEVLSFNAVWVPLEADGSLMQMRKQHRGGADEIVDHLALSKPDLRIEHLGQVTQFHPLTFHFDGGFLAWHGVASLNQLLTGRKALLQRFLGCAARNTEFRSQNSEVGTWFGRLSRSAAEWPDKKRASR